MTSVSRTHSSNRGFTMSKLFNRKTAVGAIVATALLGGGVAYAYPPDQALTVAATASSDGTTSHIVVTVSNANPGCATKVEIGDGPTVTIPASGNSTTVTTSVDVTGLTGRHSVSARTVDCPKGSKEKAKSKFVVLTASNNITSPATAVVRTSYVISFSGLTPDTTTVSVIATGPPGQQLSDDDTVDKRGNASVKLKFKAAGTWTLVTTITTGGASPTTTSETKTITVTTS